MISEDQNISGLPPFLYKIASTKIKLKIISVSPSVPIHWKTLLKQSNTSIVHFPLLNSKERNLPIPKIPANQMNHPKILLSLKNNPSSNHASFDSNVKSQSTTSRLWIN
jgi:hypothetical protein